LKRIASKVQEGFLSGKFFPLTLNHFQEGPA
jgi:hypothetical protein